MDKLKDLFSFMGQQFQDNKILNYAAQLSYSFLLAFIPLIMLMYNLAAFISVDLNSRIVLGLQSLLPSFLMPLLETASTNALGPQTSHLGNIIFGFFILYFSVFAMRALIITTTKVMFIAETRNYFYLWWIGFLYLLIFSALLIAFFFIYFLTHTIMTTFFEGLGLSFVLLRYWRLLSLCLIASYMALILTLVYMYAPPKPLPFLNALPGSILVSLGWLSVTFFYDYFVKNYFNAESFTVFLEGPFSFIVMVYLICLLLVLGSVLNLYYYNPEGGRHGTLRTL